MFMPDASDFIHNSLHCEWAYIANLDEDKFEIWKGLQSEPDSENDRYPQEADRTGYYPCTMLKEYDLNNLPEQGIYLSDYFFFKDLYFPCELNRASFKGHVKFWDTITNIDT